MRVRQLVFLIAPLLQLCEMAEATLGLVPLLPNVFAGSQHKDQSEACLLAPSGKLLSDQQDCVSRGSLFRILHQILLPRLEAGDPVSLY